VSFALCWRSCHTARHGAEALKRRRVLLESRRRRAGSSVPRSSFSLHILERACVVFYQPFVAYHAIFTSITPSRFFTPRRVRRPIVRLALARAPACPHAESSSATLPLITFFATPPRSSPAGYGMPTLRLRLIVRRRNEEPQFISL